MLVRSAGGARLRDVWREWVGALFPPLRLGLLRPGIEDQPQLGYAFLVGRRRGFGAVEAAEPVGDERSERCAHRGRERRSCVRPLLERDSEGDVSGASPAGSFQLRDDLVTVRDAGLERPIRRRGDRWRGGSVTHASLGELTYRLEAVLDVPERL